MAFPPLNALRCFETVARLGSFKSAVAHLCVTQSAVSHQIKRVEDWLGEPLFAREANGVRLLRQGEGLSKRLTLAFAEIENAAPRPMRTGVNLWSTRPFHRWRCAGSFQDCRLSEQPIPRSTHRSFMRGMARSPISELPMSPLHSARRRPGCPTWRRNCFCSAIACLCAGRICLTNWNMRQQALKTI